jgi:hypothetical protein
MPRYANLKGSMNPFDNNKPVLSSSERLKNKRDKTIYQAQKQHFQSKRKCGNKNVKYYNNGTMRSIQDYKLQQSLARGNVLCEDCNDRGTLCGSTTRSNFGKIGMGNNLLSEFWGGGGIIIHPLPNYPAAGLHMIQIPGFNVIQSDISGVWGPASPPEISKADLSGGSILLNSDPPIAMPWGYVNNLIKIPRNLDGNLVVIDGSNVLFPADMCTNLNHLSRTELFPYMNLSNLKTLVKVTGVIPIVQFSTNPLGTRFFVAPGTCRDPSYNSLPGSVITLSHRISDPDSVISYGHTIFTGTILSLCCVREMDYALLDPYGKLIPYHGGDPTTGEEVGPVGVFDMYIEVFNIADSVALSAIVNSTPNNPNGNGLGPDPDFPPPDATSTGTGDGGWRWWDLQTRRCRKTVVPRFILTYPAKEPPSFGLIGPLFHRMQDNLVESVKMIQGLPNLNQTVGNATKQSYMSCLEDGTKKINFATDNVKKNTLIKGYCGGK